jgi:uncharacterized Fe-S center protein
MTKAKVIFTKEISPESLVRIYETLGVKLPGKVAVKIHMGEPGGNNYLKPSLVKDLVLMLNGTFVDCNTTYGGRRDKTEDHLQAVRDHGFTEYAPVDIMDADGELVFPVVGGKHLHENYVGSHLKNYDSILLLNHFKGHAMGGFGGALKNMSIGIASSKGKAWIHSAGTSLTDIWNTPQDDFLESMAEAASTIVNYEKENIVYISVMNNMSIDCDCDSNPHAPELADIGVLASLDPVALDKACVDLVYNSPDPGKKHLIERIEKLHGIHTVETAEKLGIGTTNYELIDIDKK